MNEFMQEIVIWVSVFVLIGGPLVYFLCIDWTRGERVDQCVEDMNPSSSSIAQAGRPGTL